MEIKEPSNRYNPNGNGFITLHRKLLSSPIFENPNDLKIWIWCLLRANHSNTSVFFGYEEIQVKRGQFIFGRFTASKELSMNPSTVYKILKKLEKAGMIEIKSNNKKSLLSIINYECYQDNDIQKEQQSNNRVTTEEQQSNTDNKDNKNNKDNKEHTPIKKMYGEFQNVSLTDLEYEKLLVKIGVSEIQRAIDILSSYKKSHGKSYKSDYATFHSWVIDKLNQTKANYGKQTSGAAQPTTPNKYAGIGDPK